MSTAPPPTPKDPDHDVAPAPGAELVRHLVHEHGHPATLAGPDGPPRGELEWEHRIAHARTRPAWRARIAEPAGSPRHTHTGRLPEGTPPWRPLTTTPAPTTTGTGTDGASGGAR